MSAGRHPAETVPIRDRRRKPLHRGELHIIMKEETKMELDLLGIVFGAVLFVLILGALVLTGRKGGDDEK